MAEKEAVKKLTQAQKSYLVKRINDIANVKIRDLGGTGNYGAQNRCYYGNCSSAAAIMNKHNLGSDALMAIVNGAVKLRNKSDVIADLKSVAIKNGAGQNYISVSFDKLIFIDLESLEKFNDALNKKKKSAHEDKQKRLAAVRDEADNLKDSVMLDGNLAIELLDKFEKKEF